MLIVLVFMLFSILGVSLFKGIYWFCDGANIPPEIFELPKLQVIFRTEDGTRIENDHVKRICMDYGGNWLIRDANFDTFGNAFITMIKSALTEGWIGYMYENSEDAGYHGY